MVYVLGATTVFFAALYASERLQRRLLEDRERVRHAVMREIAEQSELHSEHAGWDA